mmetsp:Transcript_117931/g.340918  ORF Transcript_117931/g.340918 Transcript_117931/m.340918 type:complete len:216 (+) Transcript_117931:190-837(+)
MAPLYNHTASGGCGRIPKCKADTDRTTGRAFVRIKEPTNRQPPGRKPDASRVVRDVPATGGATTWTSSRKGGRCEYRASTSPSSELVATLHNGVRPSLDASTTAEVLHWSAAERAGALRVRPAADACLVEGVGARQLQHCTNLVRPLASRPRAEQIEADGTLARRHRCQVVAHHQLWPRREDAEVPLPTEASHQIHPHTVIAQPVRLRANECDRH